MRKLKKRKKGEQEKKGKNGEKMTNLPKKECRKSEEKT